MVSEIQGSKVLITGGLGFIGSNLAHSLVSLGAIVTLVDSLIPQYGGNLFNVSDISGKVNINFSDVRDVHSMRYLVKDQDYLFNLAGQTSHMDSMRNPHDDLEINCRAQLDILETCRKFNPDVKIIFASTRQIYGKPEYLPVDERHQLKPVDVNGINKIAGEQYHILYNNVYGIRTCALRLTNTYGPRMRIKDANQTFLGIWIRCLIEERPFEVWEGTQLRDLTYVDDAIKAFLAVAVSEEADGKVFNLGGDCIISLKDLADLLISINGRGEYHLRRYPPERKKIDIGDYYSDYKLINKLLDWTPQVKLEDGLKSTIDYFRRYYKEYK